MDTILDYNIFRKDVPIYRAYTLKETRIIGELDNVVGLKGILEQIYEETRKTWEGELSENILYNNKR